MKKTIDELRSSGYHAQLGQKLYAAFLAQQQGISLNTALKKEEGFCTVVMRYVLFRVWESRIKIGTMGFMIAFFRLQWLGGSRGKGRLH